VKNWLDIWPPPIGAGEPEELAMPKLTMLKAINLALHQEMERDDDVIVLGEDIGVNEGVFRVTEGLLKKFGEQRVIDTPLAEGAIVGMAIGMSLYGLKPVAEIQFSGFSFQAFHQIENHAARYRMRSQGRYHCQLVVRMPYGGGVRALEHHSESEEAYYAHMPGMKVVIPSGPRNARALLVSAIRDPDPVIFMEPKALYHAVKEEVPEEVETAPIGRAHVAREGSDVTLVAYGTMLHRALEAADLLKEEDGANAEVVDLLTVSPLDGETVAASARKTGRVVVVHEAPRTCGVGAEVAARVVEKAFLQLEAPIRRVTGLDIPYAGFAREKAGFPDVSRIVRAARETLAF
jgi:pyruvate dehydrogenase E1 component beta subunit